MGTRNSLSSARATDAINIWAVSVAFSCLLVWTHGLCILIYSAMVLEWWSETACKEWVLALRPLCGTWGSSSGSGAWQQLCLPTILKATETYFRLVCFHTNPQNALKIMMDIRIVWNSIKLQTAEHPPHDPSCTPGLTASFLGTNYIPESQTKRNFIIWM